MSLPNTLAIMTQMVSMVNGLALYKTVALGEERDWTDAWPVAEVMFSQDLSEHFRAGGYIRDTQGFKVTTAVSWTKQTPAEALTQLCNLRDNVTSLFQSHAYLVNAVPGVDDARVKDTPNRIALLTVGGDDYLVHELIVEVTSDWTVPIGIAGV